MADVIVQGRAYVQAKEHGDVAVASLRRFGFDATMESANPDT